MAVAIVRIEVQKEKRREKNRARFDSCLAFSKKRKKCICESREKSEENWAGSGRVWWVSRNATTSYGKNVARPNGSQAGVENRAILPDSFRVMKIHDKLLRPHAPNAVASYYG